MKTFTRVSSIALIAFATLAGCGGGGGGDGGGGVTTPPTPVADQSPSGIWGGQAVTAAGPNVTTSFEFNASGPFSVGTAPFTGTFSSGNAETRSIPGFYISGLFMGSVLPISARPGRPRQFLVFYALTNSATGVGPASVCWSNRR